MAGTTALLPCSQEWFSEYTIPNPSFKASSDWHDCPRIDCFGRNDEAVRMALRIIMALLEGVGAMHSAGVMHRDIKVVGWLGCQLGSVGWVATWLVGSLVGCR